MQYIVERASDYNNKPCEECKQITITYTDERISDDPAKIPYYKDNPNKWYEEKDFFNHRVENGHLKRDRLLQVWAVEINTLEQLHNFIDKYGRIVISKYYGNENLLSILIYDDYIE